MHYQLLQLIAQTVEISGRERDLCTQYFDRVVCSKNSILEESGRIPKYLYFVESGFVRLFHYNNKGDEVTTHINCPPGFITSYSNFISQTISDENLECITDCVLLRIAKADLDLLMRQSQGFRDFSILVFQQSLAYNEKRSKDLAALTAEQRYLKLIDERPKVLHNVPMQHIASFLGMNPKSLSRIRKQIIR
ncbi:Crp/Fnr family transcriptional regulator [Flavobacterium ginsenosidimutans]|uniref:Crp/Fnr family transcriptional regulator n=1 Tax=Flavobacterium ginsenosidimutans TaxID=687844 RepID=UPI000DAB4FE1|nr:Crp/Fnr family transcriptional regulator [Flavobacterium ginsenosidimutans]KAF2328057.1 Crp/Fnr family transcriptional regulator [Flavobacterium ginsenosidimutans]